MGYQPDGVTLALFEGGYLGLKAAGVRIANYITQTVEGSPLFAWGIGAPQPVWPISPIAPHFAWDEENNGWGQQTWQVPGTPNGQQPIILPVDLFAWNDPNHGWNVSPWHSPGTPTFPPPTNPDTYPPTTLDGWGQGGWAKFAPGA